MRDAEIRARRVQEQASSVVDRKAAKLFRAEVAEVYNDGTVNLIRESSRGVDGIGVPDGVATARVDPSLRLGAGAYVWCISQNRTTLVLGRVGQGSDKTLHDISEELDTLETDVAQNYAHKDGARMRGRLHLDRDPTDPLEASTRRFAEKMRADANNFTETQARTHSPHYRTANHSPASYYTWNDAGIISFLGASSSGWPSLGTILTFGAQGANAANLSQLFIPANLHGPGVMWRFATGDTSWTAWETLATQNWTRDQGYATEQFVNDKTKMWSTGTQWLEQGKHRWHTFPDWFGAGAPDIVRGVWRHGTSGQWHVMNGWNYSGVKHISLSFNGPFSSVKVTNQGTDGGIQYSVRLHRLG